MHVKRALLVLALLSFSFGANADKWPAARPMGKSSESGSYVVHVTPGTSMGDVYGYAGMEKGPYAVAKWFKYDGTNYSLVSQATLLNPIAPVQIEVTDGGNLITVDNWHNRGIGIVLAIYAPRGTVIKRYTLADMYSKRDLNRIRTSSSSIHWRCYGFSTILDKPRELWIDDTIGGRFFVDVETGKFEYSAGDRKCGQ